MKKIIILLSLLSYISASPAMAKEQKNSWENVGRWLEWKTTADLPKKQREVLGYFKKSGDIIEKANNLWYEGQGTIYPKLAPRDAINVIDKCTEEYKALKLPQICRKHYETSLAYLDIAREYQEMREKTNDVNELVKVSEKSVEFDDLRYSEFWRVLNKVGLFDNIEKEMADLGLIDEKELEDFYGYFQEIDIGALPKCPNCSAEMRKVPIIYGEINENEIYDSNGKIVALPGGSMEDYAKKPMSAYICDKDNTWYEEHPGPNKGKVIIRRWGWGLKWHNRP